MIENKPTSIIIRYYSPSALRLRVRATGRERASGVAGRGASARDMPALTKAGWTHGSRRQSAPRARRGPPPCPPRDVARAGQSTFDSDRSARKLNSSLDIAQRIVLDGVRASERGAGSFLAQQDLAQL